MNSQETNFVFGLNEDHTRTELLKTHVKPDNTKKTLQDVVAEARAIESAKQTNKLIIDSSKEQMKRSTGQASDTARWNSTGNLERVSGVVTGKVPTLGEYVLLKERPVRLAVAKITLPTFVWKILRLQYQIPDPKLPTLDMVGRPRMDNDVSHDRVVSGTTHMQIHLPSHKTFTTPTCMSQRSCNMTHPMIMIVASHTPWKHKYTALRLPAWQSDTLRPYHFPRQAQQSLKSSFK